MPKVDRSATPICHREIDHLSVILRLDSPPSSEWIEVFDRLAAPGRGFETASGSAGIEGGHGVSAPLDLGLLADEVTATLDELVDFVNHVEDENARRETALGALQHAVDLWSASSSSS